ncbi:MAG: phosphoribosylformylglycinamidine synthase subunit PurL [Candidatus Omnitrophica bacterium]|nr:phosphoribosylformylglycinamidine synthase subunit PurL [Candidatus Omnitrophota bacterium]MDD5436870.1 phosphoribosylformylglycinamidine synthase subunit PurL [Candidatus Omnitrophota bacterium]
MFWRVEVKEKDGFYDALGEAVKKDIEDLGFAGKVKEVKTVQVYLLDGELEEHHIKKICENLLIDPVTQSYACNGDTSGEEDYKALEVAYNPGVMDPVEESARKAVKDLGITALKSLKTARKYLIRGNLSDGNIHSIAENILCNKVIQHVVKNGSGAMAELPPYQFKLRYVDILNAGEQKLKSISKTGQLFLSIEEMRAIQRYFKSLGRNPTDCELETIAQTWSEHCKHKTFRGKIEYREEIQNPKSKIQNKSKNPNSKFKTTEIDNLLKSTIMKVTKELNKPWCVSVFHDNSGIIRFDEKNNICFKVETHNHPSALEPYGGAGTGIGGVIRDPLGTGLGAKPIVNTDVFCFGHPDYPYKKLPKGVLHPKRIMKGVVGGVRDYGNRMGIPTSNGAVLFDENFIGNPLVFCGNVGIMPKEKSFKKVCKGDLIVVVGGRTGRDGIHGATFSSGELTHKTKSELGSAVQIGNPIQEKKVTDTLLQARDKGLYSAITDCGAGGLSSAVGEMGEELGAEVYLEKVPLKYKGLNYDEIWISEAQERMVLSVSPQKADELISVFESENVEATIIGKFVGDGHLRLFFNGENVCDMSMEFVHNGLPAIKRKAVWKRPVFAEPRLRAADDLTPDLLGLLATLNIASKEWIIRQYDHEVQGGSVLKPLQGVNGGGPGDACITKPILDSDKGIILSCGINPDYGKIDPYWMAASVIDEALRQIVSVGGDISRAAILDNFCWGNTNKPDRLGGLVRASRACYDIAKAYGVPFISGKDSLNNEYSTGKKTISIPPTLLISCIAVMDDVTKAVSMDAKKTGNALFLIGTTKDELGGSQYYKMKGFVGNKVPTVDPVCGKKYMNALTKAIRKGLVRSCHDCSEGGLAVALAEMAFAGGLGMSIHLGAYKRPAKQRPLPNESLLFSESNTRFIVEVADENAFVRAMRDCPAWKVGYVRNDGAFKIFDLNEKVVVDTDIAKLKTAWQKPFAKF